MFLENLHYDYGVRMAQIKAIFRNRPSVIIDVFKLLDYRDRYRTIQVVIIQMLLAVLDLIGVGIVGILGALTISGTSSRGPGNRVSFVLNAIGLKNETIQIQALVLGLLAAAVLVGKTVLSMVLLKRTTFYLSRRGARISSELIRKVFSFPYLRLRQQSLMEWQYQLTVAVDVISVGIITTTILMISDVALLLIMAAGLFYLEPTIALGSLLIFSCSAIAVYKRQHKKSLEVGSELAKVNINTNETLQLVMESYRDLFVRSALPNYATKMRDLRFQSADLGAIRSYMPYVGKFTLEVTMVLGFLFIAGSQFLLNEVGRAVANIAVFFVASARISPAVLRIQQGLLMIKGNKGLAISALALINEVRGYLSENLPDLADKNCLNHPKNMPVEFNSVSFSYPNNRNFQLENISFSLEPGSSLALIGPSGSGKSTVADLLLGVLSPLKGEIKIAGNRPADLHMQYPGAVAYVPQRPVLANKSVRENLALGLNKEQLGDEMFWIALEKAQLVDFVRRLPLQLETKLGVGGLDLSGGQIQRLCLARALLTNPALVVLDEATSALDGKTESLVTEAIRSLRGELSLVVIAHRLSTIKDFDHILYFDEGRIRGRGNFKTLAADFPDIAEQAQLMKL